MHSRAAALRRAPREPADPPTRTILPTCTHHSELRTRAMSWLPQLSSQVPPSPQVLTSTAPGGKGLQRGGMGWAGGCSSFNGRMQASTELQLHTGGCPASGHRAGLPHLIMGTVLYDSRWRRAGRRAGRCRRRAGMGMGMENATVEWLMIRGRREVSTLTCTQLHLGAWRNAAVASQAVHAVLPQHGVRTPAASQGIATREAGASMLCIRRLAAGRATCLGGGGLHW